MGQYLPGYEGIKVLGARLVIKLEADDNKTESGLIIVQDNKEPKFEGQVVATGNGARLETGVHMPMEVNVGDNVIYSRMAGVPIKYKGEDFLVINERDIIAVIDSEDTLTETPTERLGKMGVRIYRKDLKDPNLDVTQVILPEGYEMSEGKNKDKEYIEISGRFASMSSEEKELRYQEIIEIAREFRNPIRSEQ